MRRWIGIAALALASCGGPGKDEGGGEAANGAAEPPSNASNQASAAAAPRLQAGQWELTLEFVGMDGPKMPATMPKDAPLPPRTMRICVTEEQAGRNGPDAILGGVNTKAGRSRCSTAAAPVPSERIRSTVQCNLPRGDGAIRVDSEGRYSATTIEVEQQTQTILRGATFTATSRLTGRRVGDCPR